MVISRFRPLRNGLVCGHPEQRMVVLAGLEFIGDHICLEEGASLAKMLSLAGGKDKLVRDADATNNPDSRATFFQSFSNGRRLCGLAVLLPAARKKKATFRRHESNLSRDR